MHPYIAGPATLALVYRAYSHKSLTPAGILVAAFTAVVHTIHPWSIFFALLVVFFLAGTAVTKVCLLNKIRSEIKPDILNRSNMMPRRA